MSVLDILLTYHMAFLQGLRVTLEFMCAVIMVLGLSVGASARCCGRKPSDQLGTFYPRDVLWLFSNPDAGGVVLVALSGAGDVQCGDRSFLLLPHFIFSLVNIFGVGDMVRQAVADFPSQYIIAGRVCGLASRDLVTKIQLPILFRQLLPSLMVLQVGMLHATLFASLISVEEVFRVAQRINSTIYKPVEIYTALALFFLVVCLPINLTAAHLKKRYTRDVSER